MKKNGWRRWEFLALLVLWLSGCQTTPTLSGDPPPKWHPFDLVNDTLGIVNESYILGIESLEYVGDKSEDTLEYLGDVYQSL